MRGIESNLPENRQRHLDGQVSHWEEVRRRVGSAIEFCHKAQGEYHSSPQARTEVILSTMWLAEQALRVELASADRMLEACIRLADPTAERAEDHYEYADQVGR